MSTKLIDITKQLNTFLASDSPNTLLCETNGISGISIIEAHVQKRRLATDRHGTVMLTGASGSEVNCLNIVNVGVAERNRRKGLFSDFLALLEGFDYRPHLDAGSDFFIRIDKVMNPILDECLPKKGYSRIRSGNEPHFSYYKIVRYRQGSVSNSSRETVVGLEAAESRLALPSQSLSHPPSIPGI